MTQTMSLAPDLATFQRLVNSRFRLRLDENTSVEAKLAEVRQSGGSPSYEQFSLVFSAPVEGPPEQRIYELEHDGTGSFELFLVPLRRSEAGVLFEAVFNRRVESTAGGD
jgi:uncharacterized protein DUF6916